MTRSSVCSSQAPGQSGAASTRPQPMQNAAGRGQARFSSYSASRISLASPPVCGCRATSRLGQGQNFPCPATPDGGGGPGGSRAYALVRRALPRQQRCPTMPLADMPSSLTTAETATPIGVAMLKASGADPALQRGGARAWLRAVRVSSTTRYSWNLTGWAIWGLGRPAGKPPRPQRPVTFSTWSSGGGSAGVGRSWCGE